MATSFKLCLWLCIIFACVWSQCTDREIERILEQAKEKDLKEEDLKFVESSVNNCIAKRKQLESLDASGAEAKELKYILETDFVNLSNYISVKPFTKEKLERNKMLTEASIKMRDSLEKHPRVKEDLVAKRNAEMLLLYLDVTYKELLTRAENKQLNISSDDRNDIINKIQQYYALESNRILQKLTHSNDSEAKKVYRLRFEIDSTLHSWESV